MSALGHYHLKKIQQRENAAELQCTDVGDLDEPRVRISFLRAKTNQRSSRVLWSGRFHCISPQRQKERRRERERNTDITRRKQ